VKAKQKTSFGAAALSLTSIALAAGVPTGTTVASATAATGTPPPVNAADYTLSCGMVSGKIGFSPGLTDKSTGPISLKVKVKATDCTASPPPSGGPPVTISKLSMFGSLALPYGTGCSGSAFRTLTGSLTMKAKTAPGSAKLSVQSGPDLVKWGSWSWSCSTAGTLSVTFPAAVVGVQLPAVQVSGPFAGTDGGTSSKLVFTDGTFSARKLSSPGGVKIVKFQATPGNSLFLG
jgi:hypothetical protein